LGDRKVFRPGVDWGNIVSDTAALILPTWPGILYLRPRTRAAVHIWRLRPKISTQSLGERSSGGSPGTSHRHPLPPQDRSRYFPPRRLVPNPTVAVSHQPRKTSNGLRPGTIRRSLAGLRSFHTDTGLDDAAFDSTQLGRVLRGIRGDAGALERRLRIPITLPILASILSAHRSLAGVSDRDRVGLSAAYAVAYVGAFRSGEPSRPRISRSIRGQDTTKHKEVYCILYTVLSCPVFQIRHFDPS